MPDHPGEHRPVEKDPPPRLLGFDGGGCTAACSESHTFSWPCEQSYTWDPPRRIRWCVTWRPGGPDPIAWFCIASGVIFVAACVVIDWGFGAAVGGLMLGFIATLYAFTTGHFRMKGGPDAT